MSIYYQVNVSNNQKDKIFEFYPTDGNILKSDNSFNNKNTYIKTFTPEQSFTFVNSNYINYDQQPFSISFFKK